MPAIIDTHAHLDHLEDLDGALQRAAEAGVEAIMGVSMDLASCEANLKLRAQYNRPVIYTALGMHPSEANRQDVDACATLIRKHQSDISAVGEIGLDFWYKWVRKDDAKKKEQRDVFRAFLALAQETGLPAIIHSRGTWKECLETAKEMGIKKAVFHWYSGPVNVLKDICDAGYFVSTTPSLAYSAPSRDAIIHAPIEQTLIETDTPVFFRLDAQSDDGFKSEPKDVFKTLDAYCALKHMDQEKALTIFNRNAKTFFAMTHG